MAKGTPAIANTMKAVAIRPFPRSAPATKGGRSEWLFVVRNRTLQG
jgi:hypothetical protein